MKLAKLERELRREERKEYAESREHRYLWGRRKKEDRNPFSDELRAVFNIYFYKKTRRAATGIYTYQRINFKLSTLKGTNKDRIWLPTHYYLGNTAANERLYFAP